MKISRLHEWPTNVRDAIRLQLDLAPRVLLLPIKRKIRLFAGLDIAFSPDQSTTIAGVVIWDAENDAILETSIARCPCTFPYIPGLLSFREIPVALDAFTALKHPPEIVLCDGQGRAHPRRIGLACHLGLWLATPTVGCAKSRLCGEHGEPGERRGCRAALRLDGEIVGDVLRTRDRVRPLFVSPGHLCDRESARRITLAACTRYRLPEPTRLAHQAVTRARIA